MARYDNLATQLQNNIYSNSNGDINGNLLRDQLLAFINTLGKNSGFMGMLTDSNKPTAIPDGKQFYIGYNNSATALSVNLTDVGLGTLSITRTMIYVVYCDDNGWSAVDIASGLNTFINNVSASIPTNVNQLDGYSTLLTHEELEELTGDVNIIKLESNRVYVCESIVALKISDYNYDVSLLKECMGLSESYLIVKPIADIVVDIIPNYMLRYQDSLSLSQNKTYLITVKGLLWKVELYQ